MKKIIIWLAMFALLSVGTALAAPNSSAELSSQIGVVDVNRVMKESGKVQSFQNQLNEKGKTLTQQLEAEKENLTNEEFMKKQQAYYGEFSKIKKDMELQIDTTMKQALEQISKEKKLGIVLYKNGVIYGGMDITADVIKVIDSLSN